MALRSLTLGIVLTLLGLAAYLVSGGASITALIPAFFGLPIAFFGWRARRSPRPERWDAAATTLALVGLAGSLRGVGQLPALLTGAEVTRPMAVAVQSSMALLCATFLVSLLIRLATKRPAAR